MRKTIILTLMFLGLSVSAFGAQDTRIDDFIRWLKGLSADIFAEDMTLEECKGLVISTEENNIMPGKFFSDHQANCVKVFNLRF